MGCGNSKSTAEAQPAPQTDSRREKQAEKRRKSQDRLRPDDEETQKQLTTSFESEASTWPSRPPWYRKGRYTQGINILIAAPEPLREMYFTIVARNETKYSVTIGYGKETKFDVYAMRFSICCSTVSMNHASLHFTRVDGRTVLEIQDENSLNGTFVLARPSADSIRRPMLEKEVRKDRQELAAVEYIRLGSACVLALDSTNIFWDDEDDDDTVPSEPTATSDLVPDMLQNGWYFPTPCPPKLAEITQKKRDVDDDAVPRAAKTTASTV